MLDVDEVPPRAQELPEAAFHQRAVFGVDHAIEGAQRRRPPLRAVAQECRYLVKDFGTSQSPKSTRQRDSRYCPD
ncbi:MAG: hypothetical protein AB2807_07185, partial [Candidatus Sedimenticola endophacoides]